MLLPYDAANQLETAETTVGTTTYLFDADGNQELTVEPDGDRTTVTWDFENRPIEYRLPSGELLALLYDPDNRLVERESPTIAADHLVWDGEQVLQERREQLGPKQDDRFYTLEPAGFGNLISERRAVTEDSQTTEQTLLYHYDALASTRQLVSGGETVGDFIWDAWGFPFASFGTTETSFAWIGELGYYYNDLIRYHVRRRVYEPGIARWNSIDPALTGAWSTAYLYTRNNPLTLVDPSGLQSSATDPTAYPTGPGPMEGVADPIETHGGQIHPPHYNGRYYTGCCFASEAETIRVTMASACWRIHAAAFVITNHWDKIVDRWGDIGTGRPLARLRPLFNNRQFYKEHLLSALHRCRDGQTGFICKDLHEDSCAGPQGPTAYVKVTSLPLIGDVVLTNFINICPNFFRNPDRNRRTTMIHEFGRLEGIISKAGATGSSTHIIDNWEAVIDLLTKLYKEDIRNQGSSD